MSALFPNARENILTFCPWLLSLTFLATSLAGLLPLPSVMITTTGATVSGASRAFTIPSTNASLRLVPPMVCNALTNFSASLLFSAVAGFGPHWLSVPSFENVWRIRVSRSSRESIIRTNEALTSSSFWPPMDPETSITKTILRAIYPTPERNCVGLKMWVKHSPFVKKRPSSGGWPG